jgi:tetratricopeptide (TPR) repeat protein
MRALNARGTLLERQRRFDEAQLDYELALEIAEHLAETRWQGGLLGNLGNLHRDVGRLEEARSLYERAIGFASLSGDRRWAGNAHCNLGLVHHELGESELARTQLELALSIARDLGHRHLEATVLCNLALVSEESDDPAKSRRHFVDAIALAQRLDDKAMEGSFEGYLATLCAKQGRCVEARNRLDAAHGLLTPIPDHHALAMLACQRAHVESVCGALDDAVRWLATSRELARDLSAMPGSELMRAIDRVSASIPPAAVVQATPGV